MVESVSWRLDRLHCLIPGWIQYFSFADKLEGELSVESLEALKETKFNLLEGVYFAASKHNFFLLKLYAQAQWFLQNFSKAPDFLMGCVTLMGGWEVTLLLL